MKIFSDAPANLNLDPFLSIFSRWRKEADHPAEWVDLADYAHMRRGAGVVLIGKRCNFAFDMGGPAPGVLYCSKKSSEAPPEDSLRAVFRDCFDLTRRLLAESEFPSGLRLQTGWMQIAMNDRLESPNNGETDRVLRPAISVVLDQLFGAGKYQMVLEADPAQRYGFTVRATASGELEVLRARLAA